MHNPVTYKHGAHYGWWYIIRVSILHWNKNTKENVSLMLKRNELVSKTESKDLQCRSIINISHIILMSVLFVGLIPH